MIIHVRICFDLCVRKPSHRPNNYLVSNNKIHTKGEGTDINPRGLLQTIMLWFIIAVTVCRLFLRFSLYILFSIATRLGAEKELTSWLFSCLVLLCLSYILFPLAIWCLRQDVRVCCLIHGH